MATAQIRRFGLTDVGRAEAAIPRSRLLKKGTAADGLTLAGATDRPLGVSINVEQIGVGEAVEFAEAAGTGWTEFTAGGAIAAGSEFIAGADGKVAALPTSGSGTKEALGILHHNSSAGADGTLVIGRLYDVPVTRTIAT